MEVLLKETIYKVGSVGDVVKVKNGYGRNFLVPQGKALKVSEANINEIARQKKNLLKKKEEELAAKRSVDEKIRNTTIELKYRVTEENTLYGSVQDTDIQKALADKGVEIDRRIIRIGEPIKKLGEYKISIHLAPTVESALTVIILADEQ